MPHFWARRKPLAFRLREALRCVSFLDQPSHFDTLCGERCGLPQTLFLSSHLARLGSSVPSRRELSDHLRACAETVRRVVALHAEYVRHRDVNLHKAGRSADSRSHATPYHGADRHPRFSGARVRFLHTDTPATVSPCGKQSNHRRKGRTKCSVMDTLFHFLRFVWAIRRIRSKSSNALDTG